MAFPKTKKPLRPKKIKKLLFARAWCRGATAKWKINYFEKIYFKKHPAIEDQ